MSDHTGETRPIRVLLLDFKDRLFLLRGQDPVPLQAARRPGRRTTTGRKLVPPATRLPMIARLP